MPAKGKGLGEIMAAAPGEAGEMAKVKLDAVSLQRELLVDPKKIPRLLLLGKAAKPISVVIAQDQHLFGADRLQIFSGISLAPKGKVPQDIEGVALVHFAVDILKDPFVHLLHRAKPGAAFFQNIFMPEMGVRDKHLHKGSLLSSVLFSVPHKGASVKKKVSALQKRRDLSYFTAMPAEVKIP
jgi:hypothetical protein